MEASEPLEPGVSAPSEDANAVPTAPEPEAEKKLTDYVVLKVEEREEGMTPCFLVVGGITNGVPMTYSGATRQAVVKAAALGQAGTFIPVPLKSFKPIAYEVEQKPTEKFGETTL